MSALEEFAETAPAPGRRRATGFCVRTGTPETAADGGAIKIEKLFADAVLLTRAAEDVASGLHPDYGVCEQAALAIATLLDAMRASGALPKPALEAMSRELGMSEAAFQDPDLYRPGDCAAAIKALRQHLPGQRQPSR